MRYELFRRVGYTDRDALYEHIAGHFKAGRGCMDKTRHLQWLRSATHPIPPEHIRYMVNHVQLYWQRQTPVFSEEPGLRVFSVRPR